MKIMKIKISIIGLFISLMIGSQAMALSDDNRPDYQKEYDAYIQDLAVIAETGRAPANPDLEADLQKMSSNDKILLNIKKKAENLLLYAQNASADKAQIVDSVEIIRVPQEFRSQYDEATGEKDEKISTQDVVEAQNSAKRDFIEDVSTKKVANHVNPFRLLKEVEMSGEKEKETNRVSEIKDDLTKAYFNGRSAYVATPTETSEEGKNLREPDVEMPKADNQEQEDIEQPKPEVKQSTISVSNSGTAWHVGASARKNGHKGRAGLNVRDSMFID